jgi:hypothetical protein
MKFQTDFFNLCMPSTLHKYEWARQRDLQKDVSGFSAFGRLIWRREKRIWVNSRMEFHVMGKFNWSFKLIFLPLYAIHAAQVYKCARQRDLQKDVSGFSSFGRLKTCQSIYCSSGWSRTIDREGSNERKKIRCQQ